ncbi:hypothetical protein PAMP_005680 [Pampus punctatissimus]
MTAEQNMTGGGVSGRAMGDLATSSVEMVWLVTRHQVPEMCCSSTDRPVEQRASPSPSLMPRPMAADATWRPRSLQLASTSRVTEAHVHVMHRGGLLSRQAACRPLLSPFLGDSVTARLHVLCVD